jgi:hypothetical protein
MTTPAITDPALVKLCNFALATEHHLAGFWRIDDYVVAANGHLIIRRKETSIALLESLVEFPALEQVKSWRDTLKLFVVDAFTLRTFAGLVPPEMIACDTCTGSGKERVTEGPDGEQLAEPIDVPCGSCEGDGTMSNEWIPTWLTPTRLVDLRYVNLIARMAGEAETIGVFAGSKRATDRLHFVGNGWDAHLMPAVPREDRHYGEPLWRPARVLEGGAHP